MRQIVESEKNIFILDENVSKAVSAAVQETFFEMCRLPTEFDARSVVNQWTPVGVGSGRVRLQTNDQLGWLQIHFSEGAIFTLMGKLLGRTPLQLNNECLDCVGALTGIIYGRMKSLLNPLGYTFSMAIPEMHPTAKLSAPEGEVRHLIIPFRVASTKCYIEMVYFV